jgi:hypothetical protein
MKKLLIPLSLVSILCVAIVGGVIFVTAQTTLPRTVSLGAATLAPAEIKATLSQGGSLPDSATLTVSVATSLQVVNNTVARVDLTEVSNPSGVSYTVSGGNLDNGRAFETTLVGDGKATTLRYTIRAAAANNNAGSVQFRVAHRSATNPPDTPPPPATLEAPTTLSAGLLLTFKREQVAADDPCFNPELIASCEALGGSWKRCGCYSPIVVDVAGNGFNLTNGQNGVDFDITSDGHKERIAWTALNSDDAWLALDRNADGKITLGAELFGN